MSQCPARSGAFLDEAIRVSPRLSRGSIGWSVTLAVGAMLHTAISTWFFETLPTIPPTGLALIGAFVVVGLGAGFLHAIIAGLIAALSPTAIRQSGYALPYSIGTAVFTGLTPLTLAWLVRDHGLSAPLYQYLAACVVALGVAASVRVMPRYLGEG